MGYTTEFKGSFRIDPTLTTEDKKFLIKFSKTRRMARNVDAKYGVEGEWYVDGSGSFGQDMENNVIDPNEPPSTQPGLWCKWIPTDDGTALEWNGYENFYNYTEWLIYLVDNFFVPKGYVLNGEVRWRGEDFDDMGIIKVTDNQVEEYTQED